MMRSWLRKLFRYLLFVAGVLFLSSFTYILYLRWFPPVITPLTLIRATSPSYTGENMHGISCRWRSYEGLGENVKLAVIASEDQNFALHSGFDWEAMGKALKSNRKGKKLRGGSTISQQVAKNVFLWPGRNYVRKGLEAYFTFLIELLWSKERILQMYLNIAEMGDGVFGAEAAAQHYFKKSAGKLSQAEAAQIAAILPNPRKYGRQMNGKYVSRRKAHILRAMRILKGTRYMEELEGLD